MIYMKTSPRMKAELKQSEGLRIKPYLCPAGVPTIGYGSTIYPNGRKVTLKDPSITQEKAEEIFNWHLDLFEKDVKHLLGVNILSMGIIDIRKPEIKSPDVAQNRFDALVSLAYNIGSDIDMDDIPEGLGDSKLLKKVLINPCDVTIRNEFMKWVNSNGKVNPGLQARRKREADLYFAPIAA